MFNTNVACANVVSCPRLHFVLSTCFSQHGLHVLNLPFYGHEFWAAMFLRLCIWKRLCVLWADQYCSLWFWTILLLSCISCAFLHLALFCLFSLSWMRLHLSLTVGWFTVPLRLGLILYVLSSTASWLAEIQRCVITLGSIRLACQWPILLLRQTTFWNLPEGSSVSLFCPFPYGGRYLFWKRKVLSCRCSKRCMLWEFSFCTECVCVFACMCVHVHACGSITFLFLCVVCKLFLPLVHELSPVFFWFNPLCACMFVCFFSQCSGILEAMRIHSCWRWASSGSVSTTAGLVSWGSCTRTGLMSRSTSGHASLSLQNIRLDSFFFVP